MDIRARTPRSAVTWRYLPRGAVRHALRTRTRGIIGHESTALCGVSPGWCAPQYWSGTGKQSEYDDITRLPECRRCARLLTPDQVPTQIGSV